MGIASLKIEGRLRKPDYVTNVVRAYRLGLDASEKDFRKMWKDFYDTVAVEGRENEKCRMTHMPKRFWKHIIEVSGEN